MKIKKITKALSKARDSERGFSLLEATVALVILLVVILGVFTTLVFAINYNSSNNARSKALAVLQEEKEKIRSAKFTSSLIDTDLVGGIKTPLKISKGGDSFQVDITVDDDPFTSGIQINNNATLKEVVLTVSVLNPTPGWQITQPTSVIFRRVKSN